VNSAVEKSAFHSSIPRFTLPVSLIFPINSSNRAGKEIAAPYHFCQLIAPLAPQKIRSEYFGASRGEIASNRVPMMS
jgi:hypothetical protein